MSILPLELEDVTLSAGGRRLLDGVSMTVPAGKRTVILGPNGAGKSLLLRICHGLLHPDGGRVQWTGPDAADARRRQAMVFQRPVMLRRSVRANIAYGLKLRSIGGADADALIDGALEMTGLADRAGQAARTLSIGEQQRLALARAQALRPEVLFMDEPTASLDPGATGRIETLVGRIHALGTAIVMTTHDLGQARRLADEVVFLHNEVVIEQSPVERFFDDPVHETTKAFLKGELLW
ncbi:MAG: phosphate ABC transporter ATP-binding protein [Minwuia sp.]|uniref:ABC transporter ATP-binding protein n=1 Tax=Minwuia sp. TaxID=2493630 RepID=UPI003A866600